MGHQSVRIPYSTPWFKPQLDDYLQEIDSLKRQLSLLRKTLADVAKERDAALASGKKSTETISQLCDDAVNREKLKAKALEEAASAKAAVDMGRHEREMLQADNARLRARVQTLQSEVDDLKNAMSGYVEDRIKAERAAADSSVAAAQAQGEARAAQLQAQAVQQECDKAMAQAERAQAAEEARAQDAAAEEARAEVERRARLEAFAIEVRPLSRQAIAERTAQMSFWEEAQLLEQSAKYREAEGVWSVLEPQNFGGQHDAPIMLLSANWLKTQRPARLPERQKLPAEAFLSARSLKTIHAAIDKGMAKGMMRPLPIVCLLLPRSALADGGASHPDPHGHYLHQLVDTLEQRWGEFTRRRGGSQSTGVTDLGVFVDWGSIYMAPSEPTGASAGGAASARASARKRSEHEQLVYEAACRQVHVLFAHQLTTVWMIPEGKHAVGPKELKYTEAWPAYLYLLASLIKPSNLNELAAWPQLLDLAGAARTANVPTPNGHHEQEKICRRAPCEPLTFHKEHEHGTCLGATPLVAQQYPEALYAMLAGVEELDFRRCNWGDEEVSWLALVLPLCGRLQRLLLSGNQISNTGACALANAIASGALRSLTMLALDNNEIGDTGASALFQRLSPAEGQEELPMKDLKALQLHNNAINDNSALALAGAITSSNALAGCKVNLDGNPATKVSRKAVKKALKKAKKP